LLACATNISLRVVISLVSGGKIQPPQCYPQQELHPGHDAVAIADAHARLGQVQLEKTNVIRCGHIGRPLQKGSEPLKPPASAGYRAAIYTNPHKE
jgi:hypothetical protein